MEQDVLAVEERPEAEPVAVPSPPDAVDPDGGPLSGAVGGGHPSGAPEQHDPLFVQLRRPFTAAAMKWKVQNNLSNERALIVGYIDARLVIDRLNLIVGLDWTDDYEPLPSGLLLCRLTVRGKTRMDVGTASQGQPKGIYSDAFKRAGVKFGIGLPVYSIPRIVLSTQAEGDQAAGLKPVGKDKKGRAITVGGIKTCVRTYQDWLEESGVHRFGEPIDHGDVADSVGEPDEAGVDEPEATDLPDVKQPLTDEKAFLLQGTCRSIYENVDKRKFPKARFESELKQASVSHDELEDFAKRLREMA